MRFMNAAMAPLVALGLFGAACDLGPTDPVIDTPIQILLDFCSNDTPVWFAHQGRDGVWEVINPNSSGTYTFPAYSRAAIAFVRQGGSDYKTDMIFTNNLDLEGISGLSCVEEAGTKQVNGSVAGVSGDQLGLVSMSFSSAFLTPSQTAFTLTQLVDRPLDVIASRINVSATEQHANRTIIRRAQSPVSGSTMPVFNFDTEGFDPVSNTATVTGVGAATVAFLNNTLFSQLETSHTLSFVDEITDGLVPFVTIPAIPIAAGDYHDLVAVAADQSGGARGVERYFRNPANQTLAIGPPLIEPLVTTVSTTPYARMRVQILGQVEYSTMLTIDLHQETLFASTDVSMSVSASYFGATPQEWNVLIPNFDGLDGWNNSWGLQSGTVDWTVTGYYGRPQLIFGAKPNDPETVQFASRSSVVSGAQAFRSARRSTRPRHFSRSR